MYDYALFIGRFQPFHNGHLTSLRFGFSIAKKVMIVLGGYKLSPSKNDPWTVLERKKMILDALSPEEKKHVEFIFIRDRLYNEELWKENLVTEIKLSTPENSNIVIMGHSKDETSYYLQIFPQWNFIETGNFFNLNGKQIREEYFNNNHISSENIPENVSNFLESFKKKKLFKFLIKETHINCKDFILIRAGYHILLNEHTTPEFTFYSLPKSSDITIADVLLKDLPIKEKFYLKKYDESNTEGKEITYYNIPDFIDFKMIEASANHKWILLDDLFLIEDKFYADHYQIIRKFITL